MPDKNVFGSVVRMFVMVPDLMSCCNRYGSVKKTMMTWRLVCTKDEGLCRNSTVTCMHQQGNR